MTEAEKIQMEIKQKEAEVLGLKKKLEQQKKEDEQYTRWKPKKYEVYYFLDSLGDICSNIWCEDQANIVIYQNYNVFKTRNDAIKARDIIKDVLKYYQITLLPAIKNNPIVACDFSFTFDESGANTGIEDKIEKLIKAGF